MKLSRIWQVWDLEFKSKQMGNWKTYSISQIGTVITGKTPSSSSPEHFGSLMPFVTPTDFKNYVKNIFTSERRISEIGVSSNKTRIIPKDSVLVTCIGSDMGKVAINKVSCLTNQQINSIILYKNLADKDFVYYALTSKYELLRTLARGGSTMPIINKSQFKKIELLFPPKIEEQKTIAKILSSLDDKIELNKQMNATLEAVTRAIFKEWFVDFEPVRANSENRPSESASPEISKFFPSEFENNIPKDWMNGTIAILATIAKQSISPNNFENEVFNHFSIPAFDEGKRPKLEKGSSIQSNKFLIEKNSVLVSKLNPRIFRVWTVYAPKENRCVTSTEFIIYQLRNSDFWSFLNNLMRSEDIISKFQQQVTGTSSSHQRVKPESTLNLEVVIPTTEAAKIFNEIILPIYLKIEENIQQSKNLAEIRDSLLPRLISGKIRVGEAENEIANVV